MSRTRRPAKPRRKAWDREDLALLRYHAAQQTPVADIAKMLGRTVASVYDAAQSRGISLGKRGPERKYSDDLARAAVRRYFSGSETQQAIADDLGIPVGLLTNWINGHWRPHLRKEVMGHREPE